MQEIIKTTVVNKSSVELNGDDYKLLSYGINFAPTPYWSKVIEQKERYNLFQHIRRAEWDDYHKNKEDQNTSNYQKKLAVPKCSRPDTLELSDDIKTYVELCRTKLLNIIPAVKQKYKSRNNLPKNLKDALAKLKHLVNSEKIVFCQSDKDGKIVIMDYQDYVEIIEKEMEEYKKIVIGNSNKNELITEIKNKADRMVLTLYEEDLIDEELLYKTIGMIKKKKRVLRSA